MTMIEKVAAAMEAVNVEVTADGDPNYRALAKAALEALLEPDETMVNKAWAMIGSNLRYEEVFRHMIKSALSSQTEAAGEGS